MGDRDHSIPCRWCGVQCGGLNDLKCNCEWRFVDNEWRADFTIRSAQHTTLRDASPSTVAIHVSNRTADALEAAARERGCTVEELLEQALAKVGVQ